MPAANVHGDGLHLQLSGADVNFLAATCRMPGIIVLAAAARNGPGTGRIFAVTVGGNSGQLSWQAPGSPLAGAIVDCAIDGGYLLEDGADPSRWIRVSVYNAYLSATGNGAVMLADTYNSLGQIGGDDVTAANASSGVAETTTFTLKNLTPSIITGVKLWLDSTVAGFASLSVSSDGANYYQPASAADPAALTWSSIAGGASVNLYVKRTIAANSVYNPRVLNAINFSWNGV